ncbi:MAG: ATP-binding protein [Bacteroidota bacterium]
MSGADIGKELHDNLNQILAIAKLYTQMAQGNEKKREIYLGKTNELIGNVIVQIRQISKRLVIPGTNIISLFDNIGNLIEDLMMVQPLKIEFHNEGIDENQLNDKLQVTLFRIVQEQLNNILKHAKASNVTISLSRPENDIILFISDDGQGCDISKEKKGVGLINIKSRAELYDGSVTVVSKPGEGYQLEVVLPFIAKVTAGNM